MSGGLVLIHGLFGDHRDWEAVVEPLGARHCLFVPDLRDEQDLAAYVVQLDVLREEAGVEAWTLVGNSFGGLVAMHYALAYPERVRGLVLAATAGFHRYSEAERRLARRRVAAGRELFGPLFAGSSEWIDRYLARRAGGLRRADGMLGLLLENDVIDRASDVKCPVLLVWGGEDREAPLERARRALALMPQARLVTIPACGHLPQVEQPEEFVRLVECFLGLGRARDEHRAMERHLDPLHAALAQGRPWRAYFDAAWSLAREHYAFEDAKIFAAREDWAPARKMVAQHAEAAEFGAAIETAGEPEATELARRYWAISQHNIIEEERDVFPCLGF